MAMDRATVARLVVAHCNQAAVRARIDMDASLSDVAGRRLYEIGMAEKAQERPRNAVFAALDGACRQASSPAIERLFSDETNRLSKKEQ